MWDPSHGCSPPSLGCAYWFFGISIGVPNFFDLMEPLMNLYGLKKIDLTKILRTPCMEKGMEFFLDWQWWAELTSPTCPGKVLPSRLASFMGFPCLGASTWWNQRYPVCSIHFLFAHSMIYGYTGLNATCRFFTVFISTLPSGQGAHHWFITTMASNISWVECLFHGLIVVMAWTCRPVDCFKRGRCYLPWIAAQASSSRPNLGREMTDVQELKQAWYSRKLVGFGSKVLVSHLVGILLPIIFLPKRFPTPSTCFCRWQVGRTSSPRPLLLFAPSQCQPKWLSILWDMTSGPPRRSWRSRSVDQHEDKHNCESYFWASLISKSKCKYAQLYPTHHPAGKHPWSPAFVRLSGAGFECGSPGEAFGACCVWQVPIRCAGLARIPQVRSFGFGPAFRSAHCPSKGISSMYSGYLFST